MAYTYGTTNVKVFNVSSIVIEYTADEPKVLTIQPDSIEQGVSMAHSVSNTVVIASGAELPRSEKVIISFTALGSATSMNTLRGIVKKIAPIISIQSITIYLDNGNFFSISNPEMSVGRTVKGNDITKMLVTCELNGGDADTIMEWST